MPAAPRNLRREFSKKRLSDAEIPVTEENVDQELEFYENLRHAWDRLEKEADKARRAAENAALPFSLRLSILTTIENDLARRFKHIDKVYLQRLHDVFTSKRPHIVERLSEQSLCVEILVYADEFRLDIDNEG